MDILRQGQGLVSPLLTPSLQVRSVLFRGFSPHNLNSLEVGSDARSPKVEEILRTPAVEILLWFPDTLEQFRIRCVHLLRAMRLSLSHALNGCGCHSGTATVIGPDDGADIEQAQRDQVWARLPPSVT